MSRSFEPPEGWVLQGFCFALDPTPEQLVMIARFFGARRRAFNWALEQIKNGIDAYHSTGVEGQKPDFRALRKRWNNGAKQEVCVDRDSGEQWWPQVSKEVFADGIKGAVDGYWRWQASKAGRIPGRRVGFPRFKKKARDRDRCSFTTSVMRLESDRRHLTLPMIGTVRTLENTRRVERLFAKGRARILSITLSRRGTRIVAALKVAAIRPQQPGVTHPKSTVGIDVGVRRLATVATTDAVIEVVDNPRALNKRLGELRRLSRQRSRRTPGSLRYRQTARKITRLNAEVRNVRTNAIHNLTTRLAKTHGTLVVEKLDVAAMLRQKGLPGARARRRGLVDAALGEPRRQLRYKCAWYGATLVEADRYYPSSRTCHSCGQQHNIGWSEMWTCDSCGAVHQRDDNAAINLARLGDLGSVGTPVKRGAKRKTGPRPAAGGDTRKGSSAPTELNNSERSAA